MDAFGIDGCLTMSSVSGKPAEELDRERFVLDFEFKDSSFDGRAMWDILSITVRIGTLSYSWPCAEFDVYAESGNSFS
jgi:hypothetical protein